MGEAGIFDENDRVELIRGDIVMMSPIGPRHVYYVNRLNQVLVVAVGRAGEVSVQNPAIMEEESEPQPDVVVIKPRGRHYLGNLPERRDVLLAVEVADTSLEHDRRVKIPLYAEAGIPESWILEVEQRVVERYTKPGRTRYGKMERLGSKDRVTLVALPGCTIDLAEVLG
jgi:Uma2 family endonuclease